MGEIFVQPFRDGEEEAVNRAFNRAFGQERGIEEWRWKFAAEPEGRWVLLAEDGSEVVAQYGAVAVAFSAGGRRVRAGQVVDAFCCRRAGLARRGVFPHLVEAFFDTCGAPDKLALLFGFPGERHLRLGLLRLGYGDPRPVGFWSRGSQPPRRRWWRRHRVAKGFDPVAVDSLWRRAAHRYRYSALRDGAWFERRYERRPGVDYVHLAAGRGDEPEAWAVVRPGDPCRWVDLMWDGRHPGALEVLDAEVSHLARRAGGERPILWLAGDSRAEEVLARCGWQRSEEPHDLHLTVRSFDPTLDAGEVTDGFYFTMGDSDLV